MGGEREDEPHARTADATRALSDASGCGEKKAYIFRFGSPVHFYHTSPSHAHFTLGFGSSLGVGLEGLTSGTVAS